MVASSQRRSLDPKGLLTVPLVVVYLALSALSARVGIDAASQVLEPIGQISSDSPTTTDSAVSLGGTLLP
jgi:hypothetical protein